METELAVVITSVIINSVVSLLVLARNYKGITNIVFACTGLSVITWTILNYFTHHATTNILLITHTTGLFGANTVACFYVLSTVFPTSIKTNSYVKYGLMGLTAIVYTLCYTPLFVSDVVQTPTGLDLKTGPLHPLFIVYLGILLGLCCFNFAKQYRISTPLAKSQIRFLLAGIILTVVLVTITNVIIPAIANNWSATKVGGAFATFFITTSAYAVVKKRLFDIRLAIVRFVGYLVTVCIVAAIYSFSLVVIASRLLDLNTTDFRPLIIALVITTFFVSLTFHHIQGFITKLTMRIFYRHAYDTRDVLDELAKVPTAQTDIAAIMRRSLHVLSGAIRPENAHFVVFNENKTLYAKFDLRDTNHDLSKLLPAVLSGKTIIHDRSETPHSSLSKEMECLNMDLLLRLEDKSQIVGAVIFGPKQSGSMYTTQDLELLTTAAKNLAIAIENARRYEQISHFADTLQIEVKNATSRLRHANEKLKALDKLKDDFISMASHQFRTPASSIRQALHMINNPTLSSSDRKEMLKLAEASSEQLVTIVSTMLSISRLQAGRFTIDKSLSNMDHLVEKVMLSTGILAEQKGITIKLDKPEQNLMVNVDVAKINEAMSNYVENAIKYSPPKTTISVRLFAEGDKLYFEVADQGMGVPKEEQAHLFTKFYRAHNARTEQPDGNGIGLYVVKSIAEGHGGEAYFKPQDKGSLFGFWLPTITG